MSKPEVMSAEDAKRFRELLSILGQGYTILKGEYDTYSCYGTDENGNSVYRYFQYREPFWAEALPYDGFGDAYQGKGITGYIYEKGCKFADAVVKHPGARYRVKLDLSYLDKGGLRSEDYPRPNSILTRIDWGNCIILTDKDANPHGGFFKVDDIYYLIATDGKLYYSKDTELWTYQECEIIEPGGKKFGIYRLGNSSKCFVSCDRLAFMFYDIRNPRREKVIEGCGLTCLVQFKDEEQRNKVSHKDMITLLTNPRYYRTFDNATYNDFRNYVMIHRLWGIYADLSHYGVLCGLNLKTPFEGGVYDGIEYPTVTEAEACVYNQELAAKAWEKVLPGLKTTFSYV